MRPFPPIDEFEFGERHALIDLAVFRDQLVFAEGRQPVGFGERRNGAEKRLPFGDRQAGIGEARGAANDHHRENEKGREPEPGADPWMRLLLAVKSSVHGLIFRIQISHPRMMTLERITSLSTLMLRCERSEPRSIPQDRVSLLKHTLRGPLRGHLRVRWWVGLNPSHTPAA